MEWLAEVKIASASPAMYQKKYQLLAVCCQIWYTPLSKIKGKVPIL